MGVEGKSVRVGVRIGVKVRARGEGNSEVVDG